MTKNLKKRIDYWYISAEHTWKTANYLLTGKKYDYCLFFCHLAIEKLLKGLAVRTTKRLAPYTHDLEMLAALSKVKLTKNQIQDLRKISTFNILGRYDNDKFSFHKQCTREFTQKHFLIAKERYLWLKKQSQKK